MPSISYINQSSPLWINPESQDRKRYFFSGMPQDRNDNERGEEGHPHPHPPPPGFGSWGFPGFGGRAFPHRGPPPPPGPPPHEDRTGEEDPEKEKDRKDKDNGEGPSGGSSSDNEGWAHGRHGRCGGRRGHHGFSPYGHHGRGGFGPRHSRPHNHGRCEVWGPWHGGPFGGPFNPVAFTAGLFDPESDKNKNETDDFIPEADIFDTESVFVIHLSLPGAKKEDVGVNWDAENSELSVAGVIYRPGDEEFLKTLATDERKVGPFERKIRLGTRANPAQIDADGISAKLKDGVLKIDVPKMDIGFVEIRKVDIQ